MKTRYGIRNLLADRAMCWAENMKLWWAATIKIKRRRCMTSGALEVREFRMNTTDSLSGRQFVIRQAGKLVDRIKLNAQGDHANGGANLLGGVER